MPCHKLRLERKTRKRTTSNTEVMQCRHSDTTHRVDQGGVIIGPADGLPVVSREGKAVPKVFGDARVVGQEAGALDSDDAAYLVAARTVQYSTVQYSTVQYSTVQRQI